MSESGLTIDGSDLARVSMDGVAIIDAGEVVQANQALAEIHGTGTPASIVGREWTDLYTLAGRARTAGELLESVRRAGEWRGKALASRRDGDDVPVELSVCASDGCLVSVVSERAESARSGRPAGTPEGQSGDLVLESADRPGLSWDILDALDDIVYIVDEEDAVVDWNRQLNERLGYTDEELVEMDLPEFLSPEDRVVLAEADRRMVDLPDRVREMEVVTKGGERIPHELRGVTYTDADTGERYRVGVARDTTERKRREEHFERYETIVETVDDGVYVLDEDLRVDMANERFYEMLATFGFDREDVRSMHAHDLVVNEDERAALEAAIDRAIETEPHIGSFEMSAQTPDGDTAVFESRFRLYPDPEGEHRGCIGILRDITERKERERELRAAREFNAELVENAPFSIVRIDEEFEITYVNPRTEEVTGLPDGQESEALGVDIRELPSVAETGAAHRFTPLEEGETIEFEFPFESLYGEEVYFTGRGVPLMSDGVFDGAVLMAVDISERRQHEKDLERQRDELDTLNRINELLLAVSRELFESPMHGAIEETVCTRLADSELYRFAWIGKPEAGADRLAPAVHAGVDSGVVESMMDNSDDGTGPSPAGRAYRTGTVQVSHDIETDPAFERWREAAIDHDVRSAAAVPITYDGSTYGVLAVFASRPLAFSNREQRGFEMLGEAIGYALNANRTRKLLFADRVTELEFRVDEATPFVPSPSDGVDGPLTLEGYLSTGDGAWLTYFSVPEDGADGFVEAVSGGAGVETVRTVREGSDPVVAVRLSSSSLLDRLAALGGRATAATIEDGHATLDVEVPPSTDTGRFVEQLRTVCSGFELLAKRADERPVEPSNWVAGGGTVDLTERQRQALEAAYRAGYFEWPRESSAEEVAELLDVSRPTLQAHLRKAERELLSTFVDRADP